MKINVGDIVEICLNEDGFLGSYYLAQVIRKFKNNEFLVEYKTLLVEEDDNTPLIEKVEAYKVRPVPPTIKVFEFDLMEKVDAYDLDGWWVGRVTGRFDDTYTIYFDSSGDEYAYEFNNLRVHQEYENGVWIAPCKR